MNNLATNTVLSIMITAILNRLNRIQNVESPKPPLPGYSKTLFTKGTNNTAKAAANIHTVIRHFDHFVQGLFFFFVSMISILCRTTFEPSWMVEGVSFLQFENLKQQFYLRN